MVVVKELDQAIQDKTKLGQKKEGSAVFSALLDHKEAEAEPEEEKIDLTGPASKLKSTGLRKAETLQKTTDSAAEQRRPVKSGSFLSGIEELASDDPVFDKAKRKRKSIELKTVESQSHRELNADVIMAGFRDEPRAEDLPRESKKAKSARTVKAVNATVNATAEDEADVKDDQGDLVPIDRLLSGMQDGIASRKDPTKIDEHNKSDQTESKQPSSPKSPTVSLSTAARQTQEPAAEEVVGELRHDNDVPMHFWTDLSMDDELDKVRDAEMTDGLEDLLAQQPATPAESRLKSALLKTSFDSSSTSTASKRSGFNQSSSRRNTESSSLSRRQGSQSSNARYATELSPPTSPADATLIGLPTLGLVEESPAFPTDQNLNTETVEPMSPSPRQEPRASSKRGKLVVRFAEDDSIGTASSTVEGEYLPMQVDHEYPMETEPDHSFPALGTPDSQYPDHDNAYDSQGFTDHRIEHHWELPISDRMAHEEENLGEIHNGALPNEGYHPDANRDEQGGWDVDTTLYASDEQGSLDHPCLEGHTGPGVYYDNSQQPQYDDDVGNEGSEGDEQLCKSRVFLPGRR